MGYNESIHFLEDKSPIHDGNYLITGATGLIGRSIIDLLLAIKERYKRNIIILVQCREKNILSDIYGEKLEYVLQDVREPLNLDLKIDYIFHLASNANPKLYVINPVDTLLTSVIGTKNILDYCKDNPSTRMVFASTFEVYGSINKEDSIKEDDIGIIDISSLRNCYAEGKRCAEVMIHSYCNQYQINASIARLPSVFGPTMKQDDNKAHAQFVKAAARKEDIILKSKGEQIRSYCYVLDVVNALMYILRYGNADDVYNVSSSKTLITIRDFAEKCAKIAGTKLICSSASEFERSCFSKEQNIILDNKKIKDLGWESIFEIDTAIEETVEGLKLCNLR